MGSKDVTAKKNEYGDGIVVIDVEGKIVTNLSGTEVVGIVESLIKSAAVPKIIINLKGLKYIDSFSFNWILNIYRQIAGKGGILAMCEPNDDILELFRVTNFGKALPIYATEADARNALTAGDDSKRIAR